MWQVECQTPAHAIQLAQALQFGRVGSVVGVSFFFFLASFLVHVLFCTYVGTATFIICSIDRVGTRMDAFFLFMCCCTGISLILLL